MRVVLGVLVLVLVVACGGARSPSSADMQLTEVTQSSKIVWNGVVVTSNRIFVEGQRWAQRAPAPSVAEPKDGGRHAMWLEPDGTLWAPTPELDRIQAGKPATVRLWKLRTR